MKLKDLLAEGLDEHAEDGDPESGVFVKSECEKCGEPTGPGEQLCKKCASGEDEACPGCGRMPGDGYGSDCDDPMGCGYWKDWAKQAVAELHHDMKKENGKQHEAVEGDMFGDWMGETLRLEDLRRKQNAAPVVKESYGHLVQRRYQERPENRTRIGKK